MYPHLSAEFSTSHTVSAETPQGLFGGFPSRIMRTMMGTANSILSKMHNFFSFNQAVSFLNLQCTEWLTIVSFLICICYNVLHLSNILPKIDNNARKFIHYKRKLCEQIGLFIEINTSLKNVMQVKKEKNPSEIIANFGHSHNKNVFF